MSELPTLDQYCKDYGDDGFYVVLLDPSDPIDSLRPYFDGRGFELFHCYMAYPYSGYLDDLGCNGYVPYGVIYDRDGYIRVIDDPTPVWDRVIEQCLGIYEP